MLVPGGYLARGRRRRGEEVAGLLAAQGYADVRASGDLAGRDRVVEDDGRGNGAPGGESSSCRPTGSTHARCEHAGK